MIYQWKSGAHIKTPAEVAAKVLNELASKNTLDAETLVEVSRPNDAPLHSEFEWDDKKAADEWRKHRGRIIINSITVVEETEENAEPIRCFFQIDKNTSLYEPIGVIVQNADKMELLRQQAYKELTAYANKYSSIIKKIGAEDEINNVMEKLGA